MGNVVIAGLLLLIGFALGHTACYLTRVRPLLRASKKPPRPSDSATQELISRIGLTQEPTPSTATSVQKPASPSRKSKPLPKIPEEGGYDVFTTTPGPTPSFTDYLAPFEIDGRPYRWFKQMDEPILNSLSQLRNHRDETLLVLGYQVCFRTLPDGRLLLWHHDSSYRDAPKIHFTALRVQDLEPITDLAGLAANLNSNRDKIAFQGPSESYSFSYRLNPGEHSCQAVEAFRPFDEVLVLAAYDRQDDFNDERESDDAVFAFDFEKGSVEVIPQNWFNLPGTHYCDYEWLARVTRGPDGHLLVEAVRLGQIKLDETGHSDIAKGYYGEFFDPPPPGFPPSPLMPPGGFPGFSRGNYI